VALVLVATVAAVLAAVGVWRDRPVPEAPPALASVGAAEQPPSPPSPPPVAGAPVVVSIVGKVRKPGLVRVPDGARVADAIGKAGGPLPGADLTTVNLARRVADGEQILVGLPQPSAAPSNGAQPDAAPWGSAAGGERPGTAGGKVDLNHATVEQLDTLPGVGPVTARHILDWRTQHGRFTSVEQLREVDGIGERRFQQLKSQVTV
jgi:competence protein ComEA